MALAPVLNLTGADGFDPLKITDLLASEFATFEGVTVVPVNLVLAELERYGQDTVQSPADAVELAAALGADATLVVAITEYNAYHPPVVGLVMQWYDAPGAASAAAAGTATALSDGGAVQPRRQVQRTYNAAADWVDDEVREYADDRDEHESPYGWRRYIRSQELYVRYCGWSLFRTMVRLDEKERGNREPHEAQR